MVYIIKNEKGSFVVKLRDGRPALTTEPNHATEFPTYKKAQGYLNGVSRIFKGCHKWAIIPRELSTDAVKVGNKIHGEMKSEKISDDIEKILDEFKNKLSPALECLHQYESKLSKELSEQDKMLDALKHYAENFSASASEACILWKKQESITRYRRPIKKKLEITRKIGDKMRLLLDEFDSLIEAEEDNYIYHPKALVELFEEKIKRLESKKK